MKYVLLFDALDRHKTHVRTSHRFTDPLGIVGVVLLVLDVRLDELRGHQPRPVIRPATRFHADQAGGQFLEKTFHLHSRQATTHDNASVTIHSVYLNTGLALVSAIYGGVKRDKA